MNFKAVVVMNNFKLTDVDENKNKNLKHFAAF